MYRSLWDFAGPDELMKIVGASLLSALAAIAFLILIQQQPAMPRSIYVFTFLFDTAIAGGLRFGYRYARSLRQKQGFKAFLAQFRTGKGAGLPQKRRVMLVGAGEAGSAIIREIRANPQQNMKVVVAVDDSPAKRGQTIMGVKIAGSTEDIKTLAATNDIDEIIVAIPSATRAQIKQIVGETGKTRARTQILPSMMDLIGGAVSVSALRNVDIEDLLGREPVQLDLAGISGYIEGRVILVTGGGGSIGSELCRQIAKFGPSRLIALDNYENNVFELENELRITRPDVAFEPVIASVRDAARLRQVFARLRPQVVFHAAAHKHVPLMEFNPGEAVANNVLGTKNVSDLAHEFGAQKFVMISTDKAVNPSNIMGATKRIAEMVVQARSRDSATAFAVVRFGNVLGSNGSVIPIFRKQIEKGGPVTVTDPEITRYFMTIPEAVQLVVQAGAMTAGGEIFILDMGEPVRILDLAENLIRLSGYEPYEDIEILIAGLRPGEKMHEELSYEGENLNKTAHEKIYLGTAGGTAAHGTGEPTDIEAILREDFSSMPDEAIRAWLHSFLPTFQEQGGVTRHGNGETEHPL
ncbi:MAG: polysaccharide biosynthesis protein, partial [Clostridiales Family XIII bacterium]|jgi:FlaA1/EpsC-like NDP-sugar epimerase|nr:polysaccharide biosynthesis protein [Clostridiales Family XIII bacterium]